MIDEYVVSEGRKLRMGITTGTCAALAAQGAVRMLLTGREVTEACLVTPKGIRVTEPLLDISISDGAASCAVRKDAGDDKDATDGMLIYARASISDTDAAECTNAAGRISVIGASANAAGHISVIGGCTNAAGRISIVGGDGIGRVTLPGLDQPVGEAAINTVPRKMIREAAADAANALGYEGPIEITVYAPEGRKIAEKTFNPRLGIEGGISILGTSGIVEPMSLSALKSSIAVEIRQKAAMGQRRLILTPGNYGMAYITGWAAESGIDRLNVPVVTCSNFIGDALDEAGAAGFEDILIVGHIGKLVKLAGGVMNTHSRIADCRTEIITAHAAVCGADREICRELMRAATTDACIEILKNSGLFEETTESIITAVSEHLNYRAQGQYRVGAVIFSNVYGFIGETQDAGKIIDEWRL
ncbi:MAG: cobalamin biosynthesis protein CbiD [Lachnospiraceae bacterium]|nr:cobalamin biosynthesis protein CbiD [Lachnospiraceae bacterium]